MTLDTRGRRVLALYKDDLCTTALRMYEDGADGISTFNWYAHLHNAKMPNAFADNHGSESAGGQAVQTYIYPWLGDPAMIRRYRLEPWAVPSKG